MLGDGSLALSSANETMADRLHRLCRSGVTHISGTPSHWRRALIGAVLDSIAPDDIRLSGEIADQTIPDSLRRAFPKARIVHAYASTEARVRFEFDDALEGFSAAFVGRQGTDVDIAVVDGSLRIRSRRAATRYVSGANADLADTAGFVDTGDIVEQRNGRSYFVGRRGGVINVGGLKVHPEEIEIVINRHGGVRMSLVQGRMNPITGAIMVASVVLKESEGAQPDRERAMRLEILSACRTALPPYKCRR